MLAAPQRPDDQDGFAPLMPPMAPVAPAAAAPSALSTTPTAGRMDREFVLKNQLVERYISGRLPLRGAQDFERFCRDNPELVDEIGLSQHINAALRLLDVSGRASPWEPQPKRWWEQLPVLIGAGVATVVLGITALALSGKLSARNHQIASLQEQVRAQPLDPAQSTRPITVIPNRVSASRRSLVSIGGAQAQMADLKIDVSWTPLNLFRVTIDRLDQGRVAILHNLQRDSNGNIHLELNSSALGPGDYQLTIEGLNWRGDSVPQAWATISIVR
jgi:hypothetical protein